MDIVRAAAVVILVALPVGPADGIDGTPAPKHEPGRWVVPDFASDDDEVCVGTHPLVNDQRCISVGDLRLFLRKRRMG